MIDVGGVEGNTTLVFGVVDLARDVEEVGGVGEHPTAVKDPLRNSHDRNERVRIDIGLAKLELKFTLKRRALFAHVDEHRLDYAEAQIPPIYLPVVIVPCLNGVASHLGVRPLRESGSLALTDVVVLGEEGIGIADDLAEKAPLIRKRTKLFKSYATNSVLL